MKARFRGLKDRQANGNVIKAVRLADPCASEMLLTSTIVFITKTEFDDYAIKS